MGDDHTAAREIGLDLSRYRCVIAALDERLCVQWLLGNRPREYVEIRRVETHMWQVGKRLWQAMAACAPP